MSLEGKVSPKWDAAVRTESLSWSIVRQVKAALFDGKLNLGDFLGGEIALAEEFGVSRMAARDALRSLEAMGIVEIRMGSRGGAWVANGNPSRLVEALSVQLRLVGLTAAEVLEADGTLRIAAAELAAKRASSSDIERLQAAAQATKEAAGDAEAFTTAALGFQECVLEASQNRVLVAQFRAVEIVLRPLLLANTTPTAVRRVIESNAALLKAISAGDVAAAGQAMRDNVSKIQRGILGTVAGQAKHVDPVASTAARGEKVT